MNNKTINAEVDQLRFEIGHQSFEGLSNPMLSQAQFWSLNHDGGGSANFEAAWSYATGSGIRVGIIDEGVNFTHLDLAPSYLSTLQYDPRDPVGKWDARPDDADQTHGTEVAGVIGGSIDNEIGTIGAAPDAAISASYLRFGSNVAMSELVGVLSSQQRFHVANNSWGFTAAFADNFSTGQFDAFAAAIDGTVAQGRGGLGTVMVVAAGNGKMMIGGENFGDDSNFHNFSNSRKVISVGAHDIDGQSAFFSSPGTNVLISAPGVGLVTTTGNDQGSDASSYVSGTSFAAPLVSSAVALMLEANPELGYRDVQEILAITANPTVAGSVVNGAGNINGGGMLFSREMGFGALDAEAAVKLARFWDKRSTAANEDHLSGEFTLPSGFDTRSQTLQVTIAPGAADFSVDFVELSLEISDLDLKKLSIELISPDGTSALIAPNLNAAGASTYLDFTFSSVASWGENPYGTWTLKLTHSDPSRGFAVLDAGLDIYGDVTGGDDTHYFTNAFGRLAAHDAARAIVSDNGGTIDTLNFAAASQALTLDLGGRTASKLGDAAIKLAGSFTDVIGTSADDIISGNARDNRLVGDRGDDRLAGGGGADVLDGGSGIDTADYSAAPSAVGIDLARGVHSGEARGDTFISIERFVLSEHGDVFTAAANVAADVSAGRGADRLTGSSRADHLDGGSGRDVIKGKAGADTIFGGGGRDKLVGNSGKDKLYGGAGSDVLKGGAGKDKLDGGAGRDKLKGGAGADVLKGGAGRDVLEGGAGKDKLTGQKGADQFVFKSLKDSPAGGGHDTITDFSRKQGDKIVLKKIDAKKGPGNQAFDFIGDDAFSNTRGELRFEQKGKHKTFVYGDVDGDGKADFAILFKDKIDFVKHDFVL